MTTELRRHLHVPVLAPVACLFGRIGLQGWLAAERAWLGVVLNVSLNGAKFMSPASMGREISLGSVSVCWIRLRR